MPTQQPFREPIRITLLRTVAIALFVGVILSRFWGVQARWLATTLLALWPSFGGHWVEVWFLNWLRPRLIDTRTGQIAARVVVWFLGGIGLAICMKLTMIALSGFAPTRWPAWWLAGLAFIGIELVAHLALQLSRRPSFYNGRG